MARFHVGRHGEVSADDLCARPQRAGVFIRTPDHRAHQQVALAQNLDHGATDRADPADGALTRIGWEFVISMREGGSSDMAREQRRSASTLLWLHPLPELVEGDRVEKGGDLDYLAVLHFH